MPGSIHRSTDTPGQDGLGCESLSSWSPIRQPHALPRTGPRTSGGNSGRTCCWSSPYGYDLTIQWVTDQLDPAYAVLGSGYELPEDVRVSVTVCSPT
ncbi:MAG TPA: hypothetical protein VKS82_26915 [Streptosporangiaceae bacterium]|nr:hypothetical protein [Streptosporangiaceae bacterium]